MTVELTVDEKLSIIDQHIKQMQYSIYGAELDLIEANAIVDIDQTVLTSITDRIASATAKKDALVLTRASLTN
jgi:hypothetical protein